MGDDISLWDSLFSTSHVFLLGVAIGAFLTYHYLVKRGEPESDVRSNLKSSSELLNLSSSGSWRDSNPDLQAEQINRGATGRRRSSLLYH